MAFMKYTGTALKNLFSKPATEDYPFKEREYPKRSRGHIEIDFDKCILCSMCQRKCPSAAIVVDRANKTWSIDRMGCVQCANCVNSCPRSCLSIVPGYTSPADKKIVDVYKKEEAESENKAEVSEKAKIANDFDKCILCTLCARKCPEGAITVDRAEKIWSIDRDKCVKCGVCIDACLKMHALSFSEEETEDTYKKES